MSTRIRSRAPRATIRTASPLLRWATPAVWAEHALEDLGSLLSDHAYLERKAASNALELLNRWPEPGRPARWESTLASIARDETAHLSQVLRHLAARGLRLARLHKSDYAAALRGCVRNGRGKEELLDRLLTSALIEARSHERFVLLAQAARSKDAGLSAFYAGLADAEAGHYQVFLALAGSVLERACVEERWDGLREAESQIIQQQAPGARIHAGAPR